MLDAFVLGVAALLDFTGALAWHNRRTIMERTDADALRSDWEAVGRDLWAAIRQYDNDQRNR